MFRNYLKIAYRNLTRNKLSSFINIFGLALGMASSILIIFWVVDELGTDRFHREVESIYLVRNLQQYGNHTEAENGTVPALGPALKAEYPEIKEAARFLNSKREFLFTYDNIKFKEEVKLGDPEIFRIFTFPLVRGNIEDVFSGPNVIVLSESLANKYFGRENPVGKIITLDHKFDLKVAGIMKNIPHNSTIKFEAWVPLESAMYPAGLKALKIWYNQSFRTYVRTDKNIDLENFNKKISGRVKQSESDSHSEPFLYPFKKVYLQVWGRMAQVRTFTIIAFLILFIACINYVNLTTARYSRRTREVGIRKVIGANKGQLIKQFFGESILFTFFSLVVALLLVKLFMPLFQTLAAKPVDFASLVSFKMIAGIMGITLLTGILAGLYPAIFLAGFNITAVLKGKKLSGNRGEIFRKTLVIIQFVLSIVLIIGTVLIFNQVKYLKNKELGFNKEHLMYIRVEGKLKQNYSAMKNELLRHPGINSVALTTHSPTGIYSNGQDWDWEGRDPNVNPLVTVFGVDNDFLQTFQMELLKGESFLRENSLSIIVNEKFAKIIDLDNIIGAWLSLNSYGFNVRPRIIGVVKDFHFKPLNRELGPMIIYNNLKFVHMLEGGYKYMFIRLNPGDIRASIAHIEAISRKLNPAYPFEYKFLDQDYDRLYRSEERELGIIRIFTFMAILISCMGLFGLASFTASQKTKEIGIRKVLGASASKIMFSLSVKYVTWILIANLIAWPIAWYLIARWLQNYAYRIDITIGPFFLAGLIVIIIAMLTVSWQALRAATANPVESLRYE